MQFSHICIDSEVHSESYITLSEFLLYLLLIYSIIQNPKHFTKPLKKYVIKTVQKIDSVGFGYVLRITDETQNIFIFR